MPDGPRYLVIHNPVSGRRRGAFLSDVLSELSAAGCAVELYHTTAAGDAERQARDVDDGAYDGIVVAGGDGTINETINGLASSSLPLGIIPMGTANVLAAELGLPTAAKAVAKVLVAGNRRRIYLGNASGRRFAMMAGIGFDAHVVANLNSPLKRWIGKGAYVWQSCIEFMRYRPVLYRIRVDTADWHATSAVIANGHFYGGRFVCAPDARLDDPRLHVCLFRRAGRLQVLRYGSALLLGRLNRLKDVAVIPATTVTVLDSEGEPVQGDGDIVARLPATVSIETDGFDVIAP